MDSEVSCGYYGLRNLSVMDDEESRIDGECVYLKQEVINEIWPYVKAGEPAAAYVIAIKEWLKGMSRDEVIDDITMWAAEFCDRGGESLITARMTEERALEVYMHYLKGYEPGLRGEKNHLGNVAWVPDDYKEAVANGTVGEYAKKQVAREIEEAKAYEEELPEMVKDLIESMTSVYDGIMAGETCLEHTTLEDMKRQLVKELKPIFNWSAPDANEPPPVSEIDGKENLT